MSTPAEYERLSSEAADSVNFEQPQTVVIEVSRKAIYGLLFLASVAVVVVGVGMYCLGYFQGQNASQPTPITPMDISDLLRVEISAKNIDGFLRHLSSTPHVAGTDQDYEQAKWIRQKFLEFGFDLAEIVPYQVLLSYPNMTEPNKVYLLDEDGQIQFNTSGWQKPLYSPEESSPLVPPNFNAYSGTGTAEGGLVYVHYGRETEYHYLAGKGINVTGNIVLARYGAAFRANIVELAERKGAVGVILYSDPKDFAQDGRNRTYPDSWWMPGMAVQSGTVYLGGGDPLTPFYPSLESAYRIPQSEAKLPRIPVQPIGYDEAEILLNALKEDNEAPADWQGALNVNYHLGPDFKDHGWKLKMDVKTANKMVTIYNTIGFLHGREEPDRYVLVGNHRDAWILGAIDPSSGTAALLEMARAFGRIKKDRDWRPRRSLIFCSWSAEEYGLVGSFEWAEEHAELLNTRAVAYLNVDSAVHGTYALRGNAAPLLRNLFMESSKKIPNPNPSEVASGRPTVFDTWLHCFPDKTHPAQPTVRVLGRGSDYTAFMHVLGIPSLDITYTHREAIGSYPLYHTLYETYHLAADIMDKGFLYHQAVAQLWAEIARNLTESTVLPFDVSWYSTYIRESFSEIKSRYIRQIEANGATLKYFEASVDEFVKAAENLTSDGLRNLDVSNVLAVRRVNDQLLQLERHFIDPHGLPNRPDFNHIIFAPSARDGYASSSFAGLTDLLELVGNQTESERPTEWAQIKQHLSVITYRIQAAGQSILDVKTII